jgi:tRNA A37 methylthiotransferase MiaB
MDRIEEIVPSDTPLKNISANLVSIREYEQNSLFMTGIRLKKLFRALPLLEPPSWLDTVPMTDWFFVRAATGCAGTCSYCAIKRARGHVTSEPIDLVVKQISQAVKDGYKEISLAGDDLGCYGIDMDSDLPTLLTEILKLPGDFLINVRFIEPTWLIRYLDKLMPIFNTGRITSFCAPIQTGSQRLLDLMNRDYTIEDAVDAINTVIRKSRVRSISSNCMVGFPGETADDFRLSYALLESCDINMYQVLKYAGRPDTPSEKLENKVPEELKENRRNRFLTKMKLRKFVHVPEFIAEKWTTLRHGTLR